MYRIKFLIQIQIDFCFEFWKPKIQDPSFFGSNVWCWYLKVAMLKCHSSAKSSPSWISTAKRWRDMPSRLWSVGWTAVAAGTWAELECRQYTRALCTNSRPSIAWSWYARCWSDLVPHRWLLLARRFRSSTWVCTCRALGCRMWPFLTPLGPNCRAFETYKVHLVYSIWKVCW